MGRVMLSIPDISCGHCVRRIEALFAARGEKGEVLLASKRASVETDDLPGLLAALDEAGYPAEIVEK